MWAPISVLQKPYVGLCCVTARLSCRWTTRSRVEVGVKVGADFSAATVFICWLEVFRAEILISGGRPQGQSKIQRQNVPQKCLKSPTVPRFFLPWLWPDVCCLHKLIASDLPRNNAMLGRKVKWGWSKSCLKGEKSQMGAKQVLS